MHAKVVIADYRLSTQNVYLGSIDYSSALMNQNRELGRYLTDNAAVQTRGPFICDSFIVVLSGSARVLAFAKS